MATSTLTPAVWNFGTNTPETCWKVAAGSPAFAWAVADTLGVTPDRLSVATTLAKTPGLAPE